MDFYNSVFPGEVKMCLGFMSFRAPPAALKEKNYHNPTNMQLIIILFQVLFKFMKRHLVIIVSKLLNVFCLRFSRIFFLINFQCHMHSICVWNMIKQSKSLKTRYDTTYIYDKYYIRTHVYVFLFSVKKRVFELSRVWPSRWPRGGTPYIVFIGPIVHNTTKICWWK